MIVRYRTRLIVLLAYIQKEQRKSAVPFSLFNSEQMCYTYSYPIKNKLMLHNIRFHHTEHVLKIMEA